MTDFPWNYVYDIFAKPVVEKGLPAETMIPKMFVVYVEGERIKRMHEVPVAQFFIGTDGKSELSSIIRLSLECIDESMPFCIVLLSEAYMRVTVKTTDEELKEIEEKGLENDPRATECVFINIIRKHENRYGSLPIMPDRSVKYSTLQSGGVSSGRFSSTGANEGLRDFVKHHQGNKK